MPAALGLIYEPLDPGGDGSREAPRRHAALKQALFVLAAILALAVVAAFVAIVAFV